MKYIDADKLIAEIERWINKAKEKYNESTYSMGRCDSLAEFRNHIVCFQQEQPSEDLEEEINSYWNRKTGFQPPFAVVELRKENIANIARHFVQWQKEQETFTHHEQNEPLDRAVTAQMEDEQVVDDYVRRGIDDIVLKYARLGAQWQKEQILKAFSQKCKIEGIDPAISKVIQDHWWEMI